MVTIARCGCGGACSCALVAGDDITVTGSGTAANPWVISASTDCTEVRACFTSGDGTVFNPSDGSFDVCVSPNAGNSLTRDANGCLFVSPGNNAVVTGCGLDGVGTAADPLRIQGSTWDWPCPETADNAQRVFCGSDGVIHGDAKYTLQTFADSENRLIGSNINIPVAQDTVIYTRSITITNDNDCRAMEVILYRDVDVDVNLPPNSQAIIGLDGDDMFSLGNEGTGTIFDTHVQTVKLTRVTFAPGQTQTLQLQVTAWRGSSGTAVPTYNRIQTAFRGWMFGLD